MASEAYRRKIAILDWQNEMEQQQSILPLLDGDEKKECEARIAECKQWISKIKSMGPVED